MNNHVDNHDKLVDNYVHNNKNSVDRLVNNDENSVDSSVDKRMDGLPEEKQNQWVGETMIPTIDSVVAKEETADMETGMEREQAAAEFDEMTEQMGEDGEILAAYGQQYATNGNERQRFQHEDVDVDEYEDDDEDDDEDVDEDGDEKNILKNQSCCCYRRRGRSAGAREAVQQAWGFLPAGISAPIGYLLRGG